MADTSRAGVYTLAEEGTETGTRFAVIPDLRESETMDPLPDAQIDEMLGFKPEHLSTGGEAIVEGRVRPQPERVDGDGAIGRVAARDGRDGLGVVLREGVVMASVDW